MHTLPKPNYDPTEVFSACVASIGDSSLRARLMTANNLVAQKAENYNNAALQGALYALPQGVTLSPQITGHELEMLYIRGMSARSGKARYVYESIRARSPYGKCPLCGVGTVTTLDHYLPKSKFPDYTVLPENLVPACSYCNTAKLARAPSGPHNQTVHPYYDDFSSSCWLYAEVIEQDPPSLRFYVEVPVHWPPTSQNRLQKHFDVFKLQALFSSNAGAEMAGIRHELADLWNNAGPCEVRAELMQRAASWRAARINCWQTAMFTALAGSAWFCETGLLRIPGQI